MNQQKTKWEDKWITIPIIIIASLFMIKGMINTYNRYQTVEQNKHVTIAKVIKFEHLSRGASKTHYTYYYNQKKYTTWDRIGSSNENCVDHFFKVNISTEKPETSLIELNHEINDSTEIVNAGFKYK